MSQQPAASSQQPALSPQQSALGTQHRAPSTQLPSPGAPPPATGVALGEQLLETYGAVAESTTALRTALEIDRTELLDDLLTRRAAHLAHAGQTMAALGQQAGGLPVALRERIVRRLHELQAQDQALRTLLAARTQEVPVQLAQVRRSRASISGYGLTAPGRPEFVDRRG